MIDAARVAEIRKVLNLMIERGGSREAYEKWIVHSGMNLDADQREYF